LRTSFSRAAGRRPSKDELDRFGPKALPGSQGLRGRLRFAEALAATILFCLPLLAPMPADTVPSLLEIDALRFQWPHVGSDCLVIDHFQMTAGERVFMRGPSGCGKSTLLSLVAGVLTADAGTVRLAGSDWRDCSAGRRDRQRADHIGYIFQQFNLLPYLSALENVRLSTQFSQVRAARVPDSQGAAEALLARMGLDRALWHRSASMLSVGQQQRVAGARALLGAPALVIADEPTSALDEDLREAFMQALLQACEEAGSALLFVSHDRRLEPLFDRVVDLPRLNRAGRVTARTLGAQV
jgi:putative ABC transport system ATP-binding protein